MPVSEKQLKDSGVEWIGKIPQSWNIKTLRRLARVVNGATPKSDVPEFWDGNIKWATPEDLGKNEGKFISETRRMITEKGFESCGTNLLPKGSVVLSTRAPIGLCAVNTVPMCINQGCRGVIPEKELDTSFAYYVLIAGTKPLEALGTGSTFTELGRNLLLNFELPLPERQEQKRLAFFLDSKTSLIDRAIEEKRKLVELLKEKRAAMIHQAVTRGLDENAELVDSGVEWIGKIPQSWNISKAKTFIAAEKSGVWGDEAKGDGNDLPCLRVADFDHDHLSFGSVETIRNIDPKQQYRILKDGSVLIEKSGGGEKQPVGRAIYFHSNQKMVCANFIDSIETNNRVMPKFFTYALSAAYSAGLNTKAIKQSTGIQNLDTKSYFNEQFPLPPKETQVQVIDFLDSKTSLIDQAIEQVEKSIGLLMEYRGSLIFNVVTGKIIV